MAEGVTEKWQVGVVVVPVQVWVPLSIRVPPTTSESEDACTVLPLSCILTSTVNDVAWLCANHLICCPTGPTATPPFTVTPLTVGPRSSIRSWPVPAARSGVVPPPVSVATTVKFTGVSEPAACTVPGTLNVYVRTRPASPVLPVMLDAPAILSTAEAIPGPPVSSTTAVTVTDCERGDHVVGAVTDVIRGPCSSQAAFTQASAGAQTVAQGYAQT